MLKNSVFVIRNHDNRYLTKKHKWRSGKDTAALFRSPERDIALNELIEVNAKDVMARLQLISCNLDDHDQPMVEVLADDPPEELEEDQTAETLAQVSSRPTGKPALELVHNNSGQ